MNSGRGVVGLILASLLVVVGCSSASPATSVPSASLPTAPAALVPAGRTQTSDAGGQVTAKATWNGPAAGAVFDLALDTHSVDLDALDLADAVLRNDRGETMSGQPWSAPAGGHHREGMLSFAGDATAFFGSAQWIELVLYDIGGVPQRVMRWEIDA